MSMLIKHVADHCHCTEHTLMHLMIVHQTNVEYPRVLLNSGNY